MVWQQNVWGVISGCSGYFKASFKGGKLNCDPNYLIELFSSTACWIPVSIVVIRAART